MTPFTMNYIIHVTLVLSIVLLSQQKYGAFGLYLRQQAAVVVKPTKAPPLTTLSLINEQIAFLETLSDNELANNADELPPPQIKAPNYLLRWPGLRDLLLTPADYNDIEVTNLYNNEQQMIKAETNENLLNMSFMRKLKILAENDAFEDDEKRENNEQSISEIMTNSVDFNKDDDNEPVVDLDVNQNKHHKIKKNAQFLRKAVRKHYMSPCHFKICNMGRKRQAKY